MHFLRSFLSITLALFFGRAVAMPSSPEVYKASEPLKKRAGCVPPNQILIWSSSNNGVEYVFCIGYTFAASIAVAVGLLASPNIISALKTGQCQSPIDVSGAAQGAGSTRRSNELIEKRQGTQIEGYNFEIFHGYDSRSCDRTLTDDDWQNAVNSAIQYMEDYDDECIVTYMTGDSNNYEAQIIVWIDTGDGTNHRTCG